MISAQVSAVLLDARQRLGISQSELARRAGVSKRLVAEVERGQRPNVSMETMLHVLRTLGISVRLSTADGSATEIPAMSAADMDRLARAAQRRATWTGGHMHLRRSGVPPAVGATAQARIGAVSRISRQAHVIARAARVDRSRSTS